VTDIETTPQTTSQPHSLVRRRWPTLAGLSFAALVAFDLASGFDLAPVLAASAAIYLGAAALGRPAAAWPLFFATIIVITVARLLEDRLEPTWVILAGAVALGVYGLLRGAARPGTGCRYRPWLCSASAPPPAPPRWSTPSWAPTWWPPASSATPPGTPTTTAPTGSSSAPWPSSASYLTPRWRWRS
jgi:hypothetical protein